MSQLISQTDKPIAVYYEHPDWYRPLFAELERRGIPTLPIDARTHLYDVAEESVPFGMLFNRMSPSAYLRSPGGHGIFYTLGYLAHLERLGVRTVNGTPAYSMELSKARQMTLLHSLGLGYPRTRVISHPSQAVAAAEGLRWPVVVKANVGGSGAGIVRYDSLGELTDAVAAGTVDLGIDSTALVQEFVPKQGGHITRVETLGGKYLYAIDVHAPGEQFNLCPADACQTVGGEELAIGSACPADARKTGLRVEGVTPPAHVVDAIERIVQAAQIDVGGIEYMIDDRDGTIVYYDINALSNFVADAVHVIGFDPHARLVDFLIRERG